MVTGIIWNLYVCGAVLSLGYFLWSIYATLQDGVIAVLSEDGAGPPWQMMAGAYVAALGAAAIWPLSVPILGLVVHLSRKGAGRDEE